MSYDGYLKKYVPEIVSGYRDGLTVTQIAGALMRSGVTPYYGSYSPEEALAGMVRHILRREGLVTRRPRRRALWQWDYCPEVGPRGTTS